jgi:hypothetical protein
VAVPITAIISNLYVGTLMTPDAATYEPRDPSRTVLYQVIADHLETFLAMGGHPVTDRPAPPR